MPPILQSFGGKESRWGACFDLSAERNQDGAHASIFRRKGIKMGRMLRSFGGKESRWGACFDLSAERNQDGAHASTFRRKGIKMVRILRSFAFTEVRTSLSRGLRGFTGFQSVKSA